MANRKISYTFVAHKDDKFLRLLGERVCRFLEKEADFSGFISFKDTKKTLGTYFRFQAAEIVPLCQLLCRLGLVELIPYHGIKLRRFSVKKKVTEALRS